MDVRVAHLGWFWRGAARISACAWARVRFHAAVRCCREGNNVVSSTHRFKRFSAKSIYLMLRLAYRLERSMHLDQNIIDVAPIAYSSSRASSAEGKTANRNGSRAGYSSRAGNMNSEVNYTSTRFVPVDVMVKSSASVVSGLAQIGLGAGLVLIGIPMLILPGPGLLSIGGGLALAAHGARKIFG